MYCLRLFVVVYKLVDVMLLLMDCMCIPTFIVVTALVVYIHVGTMCIHVHTCTYMYMYIHHVHVYTCMYILYLYYNGWPEAIFHIETGSKRLTNFLM